MTKSYTDTLAAWVKQQDRKSRDKNLVAFHAVKDDVIEAVKAGYAIKTIWANMRETKRVSCGYEVFLKLVKRHITEGSPKPGALSGASIAGQPHLPASNPKPAAPAIEGSARTPKNPTPRGGMKEFTFDPVPPSRRNREDNP